MVLSRRAAGTLTLAALMTWGCAAPPLHTAPRRSGSRASDARANPRRGTPQTRSAPAKASPVRFAPPALELGPGEQDLLEVRLANPTGRHTVGTFLLNPTGEFTLSAKGWDGNLPPWGAKAYIRVKASANAEPRRHTFRARYFVDRAGEFRASLPVRVMIPLSIDVIPDYEGSAVRVRVRNLLTYRTERGKVELRSPDRFLEDQVSAILPPIPPGETREVAIPVVRGGIAGGEAYRFDVRVTTWAGYTTSFTRRLKFYD